MNSWIGFAWLLLFLAFAAWLASSLLVPALLRFSIFGNVLPGHRRRSLWLISALPWLLPVTVVAAACSLAAAQKLGWIHDHCLHHGPGHPHLCLEHLPQLALGNAHALLAMFIAVTFMVLLLRFALQQGHHARCIASLKALAFAQVPFAQIQGRVKVLDDDQVFAFAAGLRQPAVFLSRGLLCSLSPRDRRIVLAHEVAHLRHGDLWKNLFFEFLLLLHIPALAHNLRQQWIQAVEEQADDRVAKRFGEVAVASALLAVNTANVQAVGFAAITGADSLARIRRLLSQQQATRNSSFPWLYLVALAAVGIAVFPAHHHIETLLGLLT